MPDGRKKYSVFKTFAATVPWARTGVGVSNYDERLLFQDQVTASDEAFAWALAEAAMGT